MYPIHYALFYDFHTSPLHPEIGSRFDADKITDRFLECGVDYVTFHARCNMGMAYYDTAIGIKHPTLKRDLFGELAQACVDKKIRIGAYFNGGISRAEAVAHREWSTLHFDGKTYREPLTSPFSMTMCYNSPYRDHLLAMALEVARKYPVSGFFFDCMSPFPCVCPTCVEQMSRAGFDFRDLASVTAFAERSSVRLAEDLSHALRAIDPEYLIYFNDISFEAQHDAGSYLEFECLPCRAGGDDYMHTMPHYMRTLGKPCVHMSGRFNKWSDFGGLRSAEALKYELFYAAANGLRPNIGDHLHPDGSVNEAVFDRVRDVYRELHQYDEWLDDLPAPEVAIVYPKRKNNIGHDPEIKGVRRMLTELHVQFDIVTTAANWDRYSLLVFPDSVTFDPEIAGRVAKHLAAGKKILASFHSGLNSAGIFPAAWGVANAGTPAFSPVYYRMDAPGVVDDMPLSIYAEAQEVTLNDQETVCHARLVRPAINFGWDGTYPEYYNPPYQTTEHPFLSINRQVAYFSGAIFSGYKEKAPSQLRETVRFALDKLLPERIVQAENTPSWLQIYVTRGEKRLNAHLLAYIPERRGTDAEIVEDALTVPAFTLKLRPDGHRIVRACLAPERQILTFEEKGGYAEIAVPSFAGHAMISLEFE